MQVNDKVSYLEAAKEHRGKSEPLFMLYRVSCEGKGPGEEGTPYDEEMQQLRPLQFGCAAALRRMGSSRPR
jgi:hypothetical protein